MQFKQLCGGLLLLTLVIGAFFLPTRSVQAAPATTYNRSLSKVSLLNEIPATIATLSFRTHQRGVLSLRTIQNASLGVSGPGRYVGGSHNIAVAITVDATVIDTVRFFPPRYTDPAVQAIEAHGGTPLTAIGIFTTHYVTPGRHTLSIAYTSTYSGLGRLCYTVGSLCGAPLYPGKAILVTPR